MPAADQGPFLQPFQHALPLTSCSLTGLPPRSCAPPWACKPLPPSWRPPAPADCCCPRWRSPIFWWQTQPISWRCSSTRKVSLSGGCSQGSSQESRAGGRFWRCPNASPAAPVPSPCSRAGSCDAGASHGSLRSSSGSGRRSGGGAGSGAGHAAAATTRGRQCQRGGAACDRGWCPQQRSWRPCCPGPSLLGGRGTAAAGRAPGGAAAGLCFWGRAVPQALQSLHAGGRVR